jgi:serine phosphatase RsbU (regulator of sigma subunit)
VREQTDFAIAAVEPRLRKIERARGPAELLALSRELRDLRSVSDGAEGRTEGVAREALLGYVFTGYSSIVGDILALRLTLLATQEPGDPQTAAAFLMRRYLSLFLEDLAVGQAMHGRALLEEAPERRAELAEAAEQAGLRAEMAVDLLASQSGFAGPEAQRLTVAFAETYDATYRRTEERLGAALTSGEAPGDLAERWRGSSERVEDQAIALQESLFAQSEERLDALRRAALRDAILWAVLLLAGVAAVVAGTRAVLFRVIRPLDGLRGSMLALAQGDLERPLPEMGRTDELGAMVDTLRVFRADAVRRARLQEERLGLHERLKEAYAHLRKDLDSAAVVQESLIPAPARLGGVGFLGRLRPSHGISGDTFDVLRPPNGAVHFFLIDVAGHGAGAALVSVASHYTVAQALQRRLAGERLSDTVAALNRDWPERMPYFTMIVGELRPEAGEGVLVQAGHPAPLLLHRANGVEALGTGGLPIGVLPAAAWEEVRFSFGPGDRLLLFSDGLSEAENSAGEPFGEGRIIEILQEQRDGRADELLATLLGRVQDWRRTEDLEDDMTVLILEAVEG